MSANRNKQQQQQQLKANKQNNEIKSSDPVLFNANISYKKYT